MVTPGEDEGPLSTNVISGACFRSDWKVFQGTLRSPAGSLVSMKVLAPLEGTLDWRVEAGAQVTAGSVLAWIAGPGRCGLVPLIATADGLVRWRRTSALESIVAGEPAALIDGDEEELRACRDTEQRAAQAVITALLREVRQLELDELAHPLGVELLRPQRKGLEARLRVLRSL